MPLIDAATLGEDFEDHPVAEGKYDLRVQKAEAAKTKGGTDAKGNEKPIRNMIKLMLKIEGDAGEGAMPVNEMLLIPNDNEESNTKRMFMQRLTRFSKTFGVDISGLAHIDTDEQLAEWVPSTFEGATGSCNLVIEEYEGRESNKLVLPKVA